jgi:uncharacterized protein YggE
MFRLSACLVTGLAAAFLMAHTAHASRYVEKRPFPLVNVSGEGSVAVKPDMAEITAGVSTEAKTPREASEANAKAMSAVIDAVRAAGIPENDIGTSRFTINPVYAAKGRSEAQQVVGYRVSNLVRVRIRDLARTSEVLDQMIAAGATNVNGVEFSPSDPTKLKDQARAAAFADAKRRAELYAKAAGAQLGRAIAIAEQDSRLAPTTAFRATAAAPPTPIMPGEDMLTVSVTVSFELIP